MNDFVLPGADEGTDIAAYGIEVMGEYIYGTPEGETEFFDIVFKTPQQSGDLQGKALGRMARFFRCH